MSKYRQLIIGISLLLSISISSAQKIKEGTILIGTKAGVTEETLDRELKKQGIGKRKKLGSSSRVYEISVPASTETSKVLILSKNKYIKFAEVNELVPSDYIANDKYFPSSWHLPVMGVPESWDISEGNNIVIAIADSGVRTTHQDLVGNISSITGYNFYDNNTNITDVRGHGTKVAGVAAASTNNLLGISSIAPKAKILPIRISDQEGYAYFSTMAKAITYAADNGARVINISFGGGIKSSAVQSAANYFASKGGITVFSAGNDNLDPGYADIANIIAVSATGTNDLRTSWSSFGNYVDVAAPGSSIYTTSYSSDSSYSSVSGTSFSAPIVAGVVAQMLAVNPTLTFKEVDSILKATSVDKGTIGEDVYYGAGRVNALAAVSKAAGIVYQDTVNPIVAFTNLSKNKVITGNAAINISATDNMGIKEVALYLSNTLIDYENQSPYEFMLDTTKYPNGSYTLAAKAVDMAGNSATTSINVYISNGDLTPPIVKFISPTDGAVIPSGGKFVRITTSASDNTGTPVTQKLYIDNVLKFTGTTISYNWKPTPGTHALRVDATDTGLNKATTSITVIKK